MIAARTEAVSASTTGALEPKIDLGDRVVVDAGQIAPSTELGAAYTYIVIHLPHPGVQAKPVDVAAAV